MKKAQIKLLKIPNSNGIHKNMSQMSLSFLVSVGLYNGYIKF